MHDENKRLEKKHDVKQLLHILKHGRNRLLKEQAAFAILSSPEGG